MAEAEVLPTHTPALFAAAVARAAELLGAGEVVALPTETVYGLAANAFNADAVRRIYQIKGRPEHNPIIVHVAAMEMASQCAAAWPELGSKLARSFWPGPLTVVVPKSDTVPDIVTAGGPTVGVRWPAHPFMQQVIQRCGFPLAAPSANLASQLSPTNARHVQRQLGSRIRLIIDGGQSQVGIESTVLDLASTPPRVLRPGMIHEAALGAVVGELAPASADPDPVLRSPGLLKKHYAPKARLVVLNWHDEADLRQQLQAKPLAPNEVWILAHTRVPAGAGFGDVAVIPHDPEAFARALYAELHRCDDAGARVVVVEQVPDRSEWKAIADRLARASS